MDADADADGGDVVAESACPSGDTPLDDDVVAVTVVSVSHTPTPLLLFYFSSFFCFFFFFYRTTA